jgi:hypothetical protein
VALGRDGDDLHIRGRRWAAWGDSDRRRCAVEQRQGKRKREEERRRGVGWAGFRRKGLKKTGLAEKMLGGLRRV